MSQASVFGFQWPLQQTWPNRCAWMKNKFSIFDISHCLFNTATRAAKACQYSCLWLRIFIDTFYFLLKRVPTLCQVGTNASPTVVLFCTTQQSDKGPVRYCFLRFSYISNSPPHSQSIGSDSVLSSCGQRGIACKTDTQGCRENMCRFFCDCNKILLCVGSV